MSMLELSIKGYADILAAKSSTPGGGSASALVAALGAALGSMVGNFTVGKKKYAQVETEMLKLMDEADNIRVALISCVDEDAAAFEPLSRAYAIPKDDPNRAEILEKCLRDAAAVPMKILELSCRTIELLKEFGEKGSSLMISDAATGAAFCRAALHGAAINVRANTTLMTDKEYASGMNTRVEALLKTYIPIADSVFETIYGGFC